MQEPHDCTVLLVDDDEGDYVLVREWLAPADLPKFHLIWADSFNHALKLLEENPSIEAILIDYDLGGRSGLDLLRAITQRGYSGPTIMLTGRGGRDVDQEALRLGASEYLAKSETTPRLLERTLRYAIEHKRVEEELRAQQNALRIANAALEQARDELELRVQERTAELQRKQEYVAYQAYLLENVSDAIIATDSDFRLTAWNGAAERIYGWRADEVLGQPITGVLQAELLNGDYAAATQRLRDSGVMAGEFVESTKDGRRIIIESKTIALTDAAGRFTGYVGVNRDITERKAQERLIRAYAQRMEALAQLSQELALAGRELPAVLAAVTHQVSGLIGDDCLLALIADDSGRVTRLHIHDDIAERRQLLLQLAEQHPHLIQDGVTARALRTGQAACVAEFNWDESLPLIQPEYREYLQRYPIYSAMVAPLRTQAGAIGFLNVNRRRAGAPYCEDDLLFLTQIAERTALAIENAQLFNRAEAELGERRQAEAALRASQALFESLFESIPDPTLLLDRDGCVLQVNRQAVQAFGYPVAELAGKDFAALVSEPDREAYRAFLEQTRQQTFDQPLRMAVDIQATTNTGGVFPIELTLAPFQSGGRQGLICSVHDVTVRKHMEQELAEVPRRLLEGLEAERIRLARELHDGPIQEAYGVAFGLRHAIAEANATSAAGGRRLEGLLDQIHHAIQTMRDIGRTLRPPTLMHFGLEKTIRADADQFREQHPGIALHLRLQPDAIELPEDLRMALFRIYQNAMGNVARHSSATQVTVRLLYDAESVTLEIEDDGRGFNFDGRWLDLVRQGHLGLAGSNERADAIGGKLEVDSTPGKGTRIYVTAPLERPAVGAGR